MEKPLYDILRGNWTLNRVIEDRRARQTATFCGHAAFVGRTAHLRYSEAGTLTFGEREMSAQQAYHWACGPDGACVTYSDGRAFHDFRLVGGCAEATHDCGDDHYRAAYDFSGGGHWQVVWKVRGPRKDYTSLSEYRRTLCPLQ